MQGFSRHAYLAALLGCALALAESPGSPAGGADAERVAPVYPLAPRGRTVDVYHGVEVADPYRWLEALDSQVTRDWVAAQNRLSQPWLEAIPARASIRKRLGELWSYERFGIPVKRGGRYFHLHNDGRQNQSVLYVGDAPGETGRVLFDPNVARTDATVALSRYEPSPDGRLVAYSLSDGGTDWETWHFRRVDDGADLPDVLTRAKYEPVAWALDGSGIYYSLYPARSDGRGDDAARPDIRFHRLGERQEQDRLVYAVPDHPTRVPWPEITDDGRYLVITLEEGYRSNGVRVIDLTAPDRVRPFFEAWDAKYQFIGSRGAELYFLTTQSAPRGRVIAVPADRPEPAAWRVVVPPSDNAIESARFIGGRVVVNYLRDAHSEVSVFGADGRPAAAVPLPGNGEALGFQGRGDDPETFFAYRDYLHPTTVFRYDVAGNAVTVVHAPHLAFDPSPYVTEQVFYPGADGTRIPMSITRRRDAKRDGGQPTMLYGYGGFAVALLPAFRPSTIAWLEMGGTYVEANLRGGSEYGEAWHEAGTRTHKQNVFDDFIAAAEYLIRERYTSPRHLAISGQSNGGLLVAATLLQRPQLFAAALPGVGVLDMLRYDTAGLNARQWSSDYGLAENAEDFRALRAYSPVHNVREGTCYPATLVTTADHDDRVVPWHSYKFAAALQRAQAAQPGCRAPILLRVETRAGHGAGKPVWMQVEDQADEWAFAAAALGLDVRLSRSAGTR